MNDRQITDMKKLFNLLLMCHKLHLLSPTHAPIVSVYI